ncbi:MAG: hypothetical protein Q7S59_10300 [Sulfurimonas sp.]|nr:hypothetical protein [Sulfurimonas sp.]
MQATPKYIRIDSKEFQANLAAVLKPLQAYEDETYAIVETYKPLNIQECEPFENSKSFNPYMRKISLSLFEKKLIEKYLLDLC